MKQIYLVAALLLAAGTSARAQETATADISSYLRGSFSALAKDLAAVVDTMPESEFGFRPSGASNDVRTFGEIVVHVLTVNAFVCAMGDGKPASSPGGDPAALPKNKARLASLVAEINARCTVYLETLSDSKLNEEITSGSGERAFKSTRGKSAIFVIVHSNEHYGNLVTYVRARGLVPPATPAQFPFLSRVTPPAP